MLSTSKAREGAKEELYRLVAKRFGARVSKENWSQDLKLRAKIVEFLNECIGNSESLAAVYPRGGITGKWLSWRNNRDGIDKAATGEKHGKG